MASKRQAGDNDIIAIDQGIKKTGRGGKYNFPSSVEPENPEDVRAALGSVLYWLKRGMDSKPETNEEIQDRCIEYITSCYETGQRITVEKLALALGITRETLWKWEQVNDTKGNIIKKAKDAIASYDADMVSTGKLNPVPYIFRAKNYYGMKDQQDITIEPKSNISDISPEEIVTKYQELPD